MYTYHESRILLVYNQIHVYRKYIKIVRESHDFKLTLFTDVYAWYKEYMNIYNITINNCYLKDAEDYNTNN